MDLHIECGKEVYRNMVRRNMWTLQIEEYDYCPTCDCDLEEWEIMNECDYEEEVTMNQKRCDYCWEFKDQLRATPFLADAGLSMCKDCWNITREAAEASGDDIGEFE